MPVPSVLCSWQNNSHRAWFFLLSSKCNTSFMRNWIGVSFICSSICVANHLTPWLPLVLEFFPLLCLTGFAPAFTLAVGMCISTAQSEGLRWERSGQPGAQRGAGWAVESYSPEPGCESLLLQELPRSLGNAIPARESPCGKGWVLFFEVLLSSEGRREFRVIYHVSLIEETCFNPLNLNVLFIVPETANICVLSMFLHWKLSWSLAW